MLKYFELLDKKAVLSQRKPHDDAAVIFGLKFADNIHYKFKRSQASKARIQSSKHTGVKQNLTQHGHSRSFKVTCFEISGNAIKLVLVYLLCFLDILRYVVSFIVLIQLFSSTSCKCVN